MRRGILMPFVVLGALSVLAASAGAGSPSVRIKPGTGGPRTTFAVSFVAPDAAGGRGSLSRRYSVQATRRASGRGCVSDVGVQVTDAAAHSRVRVSLDPKTAGGNRWCRGFFRGTITELQQPVCEAGRLCPLFAVLARQIGTFSFRVRR